jgi:hypothetical protein
MRMHGGRWREEVIAGMKGAKSNKGNDSSWRKRTTVAHGALELEY